ncbi:hypothetical protein NP439_14200 [Oceanobacillus jeddahense]|uniref:Uncharacterized protein n=1 Tax=Oceanobacillus jeddahense TaxID=1462527 RepID=A0ABY5JQ45_9BACI|nr:hypothetical protein [Oceanobacillus jeddahense]UUI01211.1 hypothetical protein NP439_14200 [Oceanobacillus jeddahense]
MKRPLGVTLISYFYIFGAIVLLFTAMFYDPNANSIDIAERFALPNIPERLTRVILALFSLAMVYGYIRLKKWGFWTMVTYSVVFGIISSLLISGSFHQPYTGNMIFSIVVLTYTIYVKDSFFLKTSLPY